MTTAELLTSLRSLIAYHHSCGIDHYRLCAALESSLQQLDGLAKQQLAGDTSAAVAAPDGAGEKRSEVSDKAISIDQLAGEIRRCRICPLHEARKISTAGKGGVKPDLLVIGDWLVHDEEQNDGAIFGVAEDLMLARMIAAINLKPENVFVTNVIKCSVTGSYRADSTHVAACLSYLKQQIELLSPQVICTMGTAASQTLLGSSQSLIQLRGRFHAFQGGSGRTIPVMPTFHPSYLLKNPEMKQPTWNDLQAVNKRLTTKT